MIFANRRGGVDSLLLKLVPIVRNYCGKDWSLAKQAVNNAH